MPDTMTADECERIRTLIRAELEATHGQVELADDTDLIAAGLVDSVGLLQLLLILQEELDIRLPIEDVAADGRVTIAKLVSLAAAQR